MFRAFFILFLLAGCSRPQVAVKDARTPGKGLRIYYTANRQGELDPCGCAVNQIGGLGRLQAFLDNEGKSGGERPVFFGDAGDTFFSAPQLPERRLKDEIWRARYIANVYRWFGVDAFTPGERDFAAGLSTLKSLETVSGALAVSANLTGDDGKLLFERTHVFDKKGIKVGVTGVSDEKAIERVKGVKALPAEEALKGALAELKASGAEVIVVLSHLGLTRDKTIAKDSGIDLIIGSHSLDALSEPIHVGDTMVVQPLPQGEQIGIFDFTAEKRVHRLADLGKDLDAENRVTKWIDRYKREVRDRALAESDKVQPPASDKPFVANPMYCRNCHQKQVDFWQTTKHASAYLVLYAKNQHFDPECISCHSIGFESPAGFQRISQPIALLGDTAAKKGKKDLPFVEQLMKKVFASEAKLKPLDSREQPARYAGLKKRYHDEIGKLFADDKIEHLYIGVQCEHCHGIRAGHPNPEIPTIKKVAEKTCRGCHTPPHDTTFDFEKMVKKVACPLSAKS